MKNKKRFLAFTTAILLSISITSFALADTTRVHGELNKNGSLVVYDYMRTHNFTGPITLTVDDMPEGNLRLGLRNMKVPGHPQFTNTIQWNHNGTKSWENILKGTRFSLQGRMPSCPWFGWFCDNHWGGDLTY